MNLFSLAGSLLRGGGRRTVLDLSLTIVGLAIPVAITLVVVGTIGAFDGREAAMSWRQPTSEGGPPIAVQQRADQFLAGRHIDVVVLDGEHGVVEPPGMDRFPAPGEIWVSPALETFLAERDLAGVLTERMGGTIAGVLGPEALATANELVAVVGVDGLEVQGSWYGTVVAGGAATSAADEIDAFHPDNRGFGLPATYRIAAWIAGTLLVAPSISLLGAGARLTAARRGRRLAALRLAGATSGQVTALAALETAAGSAIGVLLGLAVGRLGLGFVTGITLGGDRFTITELLPEAWTIVAIALGAMVIAVISSLAGLRGVRSTPLGVIRQQGTKAPHIMRLVGGIAAWVIFAAIAITTSGDREVTGIVIGLGIVIFAVSLMGPLFTWVLGRVVHLVSRRATGMLAGRRLIADPAGAFRPTTGVILIAFVAGFLLLSTASMPPPTEAETLTLAVPFGFYRGDVESPDALAAVIGDAVPDATVSVNDRQWYGTGVEAEFASVAQLEAARATITEIAGTFARTPAEGVWDTTLFAQDVRKATWIAVSIALIQAAFSTAVGAAASILEQSNTLVALGLAGTDRRMLQRARIAQAALPIGVGSIISVSLGASAGALTLFGLLPMLSPVVPSLLQAFMVAVGAVGAAIIGVLITRPVLTSVLARPLTER